MKCSPRMLLGSRFLAWLACGAGVQGSFACSSADAGRLSSPEAGSDAVMAASDGGTETAHDAMGTIIEAGVAHDATEKESGDGTASDVGDSAPDGATTLDASAVGDGGTTLDAGWSCNGATLSDGGVCPGRKPGTVTIIGSMYSAQGSTITYGTSPDDWVVRAFADPGQTIPSLAPSAGALSISATLARSPVGQNSEGFYVSIDSPQCVDESNYAAGLVFTLSGDLGACILYVDAVTSQDESSASDTCRGTCMTDAGPCVAPSVQITSSGMITLPNMAFSGGSPTDAPDTSKLIGFRWRLQTPDAAAGLGCAANITIGNVMLLGF